MAGRAGALKLDRLFSWKYTSDLFTFDQILQEMLRGHIGLEYTYANPFGDHAYLILFALLPFKLILGKYTIVLLTLLGPIVYGVMGVIVFIALNATAGTVTALLATLVYFIGLGTLQGLCEGIYGCHFDTFAGYAATAMAAVLTWRWKNAQCGMRDAELEKKALRRVDILFWALCAFFLSLKEEMALLGAVFFAVVWVLRRNRYHLIGLGVAVAVFLLDSAIMKFSATPWNRTNANLFGALIGDVKARGLGAVLFPPERAEFWTALKTLIPIFLVLYFASLRRSPFAMGLFAMAMAKLALNYLVNDPSYFGWHNFPGIVMLIGAILVQLQYMDYPANRVLQAVRAGAALALLVLAIYGYSITEKPYLARWPIDVQKPLDPGQIAQRQAALEQIKSKIRREKVVAIPGFSSIDWMDGYRIAFYPRGIFWPPHAIADYLVVDRVFSPPDTPDYLENLGAAEFRRIAANDFFELYERQAVDAILGQDRERFVKHFGAGAIGGPANYPVITPVNRGGVKPDPVIR